MRPVLLALALALASPAAAQHLGARQQWQPEIADLDARLQQPVEIEIIGRAAVPALKMLASATGVDLQVAPEDLDTVGERKVSIISRGLPLKAIMVQLPEALQECHWDIEPSGSDFVYCLHRNGGAEKAMERLREGDSTPLQEARRHRLEAARAALKMSGAELAELEQTDLYLARVMKEPQARARLAAFLDLPNAQLEEAVKTGNASMKYDDMGAGMQEAAIRLVEDAMVWIAEPGKEARPRAEWMGDLAETTITFWWRAPEEVRVGFFLQVVPDEGAYVGRYVIPAKRAPAPHVDVSSFKADAGPPGAGRRGGRPRVMRGAVYQASGGPLHHLLRATGTGSDEEAERMILQASANYLQGEQEREEERREREWVVRDDPDLQQPINPYVVKYRDLAEFQLWLADETGLSIVSDYFTGVRGSTPMELQSEETVPLWRLLYAVGDRWEFRWQKVGRCLRFHNAKWYDLAPTEIPESLLFPYLRKYHAGELQLEDVVALVSATQGGRLRPTSLPTWARHSFHYPSRWALFLYASLSPEQRGKLRSADGLPVTAMTASQRQEVLRLATDPDIPWPHSRDDLAGAVFRIEESEEERGTEDYRTIYHEVRLFLEFTDGTRESGVVRLRRFPTDILYAPLVHAAATQ